MGDMGAYGTGIHGTCRDSLRFKAFQVLLHGIPNHFSVDNSVELSNSAFISHFFTGFFDPLRVAGSPTICSGLGFTISICGKLFANVLVRVLREIALKPHVWRSVHKKAVDYHEVPWQTLCIRWDGK